MSIFKKRTKPVKSPDHVIEKNPVTDLKRRWEKSDIFTELSSALTVAKTIDCVALINKATAIHNKRDLRLLHNDKSYTIADLSDVALQESAFRSKLVGLLRDLKIYIPKLEALRKAVKIQIS
jgi:hypothetical protein